MRNWVDAYGIKRSTPIPDPDDPSTFPTGLKWRTSFKIDLEVKEAEYENKTYVGANNTDPYLVPPPSDASFYAGDAFSYKMGYIVDEEGDNVDFRVDL